MAQVIKLKRGTTTPSTSNLVDGEVAVDTSAQKFYINDSGTIKEIGGGSAGLQNVVEDTTPQLGGDLDLNNNDITGTGNITITGEVNATQVQLSGGAGDEGTLAWNADEETLDLIQNNTTLQLGQEVVYHVRNNSGASIADGTPVMATGTLGASGRITIAPMDGTNVANAKFYLGVATETIPNDADGKVTYFGKVRGIDTSVWSEGDVLWISTDTVGAFTTTEPTIGIKIPTAFVLNSTNNGTIVVRATNSVGLADLDDVTISSPASGELVYYDGSKFTNNSTTNLGLLTESDLANAANVEDTFTANGSTINFILSEAPAAPENILVSVDGVVQPSSSYSVSSLTLTIAPALPDGTSIRVLHLKPLMAEAVKPKHTTETSVTLAAANMNTTMTVTGDVTVNNNVGTAGDSVLIYNNSSSDILIIASTITTMRLAGTETTGTRTLAGRGLATIFYVSPTEVTVGGSGLT